MSSNFVLTRGMDLVPKTLANAVFEAAHRVTMPGAKENSTNERVGITPVDFDFRFMSVF